MKMWHAKVPPPPQELKECTLTWQDNWCNRTHRVNPQDSCGRGRLGSKNTRHQEHRACTDFVLYVKTSGSKATLLHIPKMYLRNLVISLLRWRNGSMVMLEKKLRNHSEEFLVQLWKELNENFEGVKRFSNFERRPPRHGSWPSRGTAVGLAVARPEQHYTYYCRSRSWTLLMT